MTEEAIKLAAEAWARTNKKRFAKDLTDVNRYPGETTPVSVFMAGSPGAGKTESSKALVEKLKEPTLRIDPDEFRPHVPGYTGTNSYLFQGAVSILLGKVLDMAFDQRQSFILDGTLSNWEQASRNVGRALAKGRDVLILYVYQHPAQAWEFVKAREHAEGRRIPGERFIEQFFSAHNVVNRLKVKYDSDIQIDVIVKDINGGSRRYMANVTSLDAAAPLTHTPAQLQVIVGS